MNICYLLLIMWFNILLKYWINHNLVINKLNLVYMPLIWTKFFILFIKLNFYASDAPKLLSVAIFYLRDIFSLFFLHKSSVFSTFFCFREIFFQYLTILKAGWFSFRWMFWTRCLHYWKNYYQKNFLRGYYPTITLILHVSQNFI